MDIIKNSESQNQPNDGEFDSTIMNFLMRRINVKEIKIGDGTFTQGVSDLKIIQYNFDGFPGYGFNSYQNKSYWTRQILELLEETVLIPENWHGDLGEKDPERQKIIKTVRKFIKNILIK
jgi:hypothetical protein